MSGIVDLLIGDNVVEWFTDGDIPELHGTYVWVRCGSENENGEFPYCAVALPQVRELSELSTVLLSVGALEIKKDTIAFNMEEDRLRDLSFRNREILLLLTSCHETVTKVFSAIVYQAHGASNN